MSKQFLIIDPYLLIYPDATSKLDRTLVARFISNLNMWSEIVQLSSYEVGITQDSIDFIKHHPRSILNGIFIEELLDFTHQNLGTINILIAPIVSKLKNALAFAQALNEIDDDILIYEIKSTAIAPSDFIERLPEYLREEFLMMLGHLVFARQQQIVPIATFEQVLFATTFYTREDPDWLTPYLYISVSVDYETTADDDIEKLQNPVQDQLEIVKTTQDLPPEAVTSRTLADVLDAIQNKYPNSFLISQELQTHVKKNRDTLTDANRIEYAIEGLHHWLDVYRQKRDANYTEYLAFEEARRIYRQKASHDITGASKTVSRTPSLSNERLVRYNGNTYYAHWHIKITPRIYFTAIPTEDTYMVLLGKITAHLSTARHSM